MWVTEQDRATWLGERTQREVGQRARTTAAVSTTRTIMHGLVLKL